jgi:hypothetical protein
MRTLGVIDLKQTGPDTTGWLKLRAATMPSAHSVPAGILLTPAGFGFFELPGGASHNGRQVEIVPPRNRSVREASSSASRIPSTEGRALPVVTLRSDGDRARSGVPRGGLILEVGADRARVELDEQAYDLVAAPILLAIAQCWRFQELGQSLDELCDWAREQSPGRETVARLECFQRLLLELPAVEGPLTDPRGFFATVREARLYRSLARALGLPGWRALIDERIEVIEAALTHLAEERRVRVSVTAALVLEVLILIVLLADLAINVWQTVVAE